jgi:hypothetical protein
MRKRWKMMSDISTRNSVVCRSAMIEGIVANSIVLLMPAPAKTITQSSKMISDLREKE